MTENKKFCFCRELFIVIDHNLICVWQQINDKSLSGVNIYAFPRGHVWIAIFTDPARNHLYMFIIQKGLLAITRNLVAGETLMINSCTLPGGFLGTSSGWKWVSSKNTGLPQARSRIWAGRGKLSTAFSACRLALKNRTGDLLPGQPWNTFRAAVSYSTCVSD